MNLFQSSRRVLVAVGVSVGLQVVVSLLIPNFSFAGEIYGHVAREGRVFPNAQVKISCPSFSSEKTTTTDRKGRYRLSSGPRGEEKCVISVRGLPNSVTIYSSKRRTRANLEVVKGRLHKR